MIFDSLQIVIRESTINIKIIILIILLDFTAHLFVKITQLRSNPHSLSFCYPRYFRSF